MDVIQMRHTRETAIKQWSATFKVSLPRAQGGDTAGRDVRATDGVKAPRNSCKGVQRYHYPSLERPNWRLRISEIRSRQSAPRVIPNLAKPSKSFLSEESVTLKN